MHRLLLFLALVPGLLRAQTPQEDIRVLCSEEFAGRGYVNDGLEKASAFIAKSFKKAGLKKLGRSWYQDFHMRVNTFPGEMSLSINNKALQPGVEFLAKASNPTVKGSFKLKWVRLQDIRTDSAFQNLRSADYSGYFLLVDTMTFEEEEIDKRYKKIIHNSLNADGILICSKRQLLWTVAHEQSAFPVFEVMPGAVPSDAGELELACQAELIVDFETRNVIGYVKGKEVTASFLFVTAHYDHLGMMGKQTVFPGANDNASGTAMLLHLARYYAEHPQRYSVVFVAFSAEEAGLVGSYYFTENSPVDLARIRFLMNLDLEGTGADGITAVNATVYEADFALLQKLNEEGDYLKQVAPRGKAANSDHHWFTEKGVPCFFIYQMGEYGHYHDPGDTADKLPLTAFDATCELVIRFFSRLQGVQN